MFKQPVFWLVLGSALALTMITRNVLGDRNELYAYSEDLPEILNLVDRAYVDRVSMDKLMPGVYQGALEAVDPNASYVAPNNLPKPYWDEVYRKWGLVLDRNSGFIRIVAVAPDSPAAEAGLTPGSYLRRVGATSTRRMNTYQIRRDLTEWEGPLPLSVVDTVHDKKSDIELEPKDFEFAKISAETVDDHLLLITLTHFYDAWEQDLEQVVSEAHQSGARLLLDLRNNALGTEQDLQSLAKLFLAKGEIMTWKAVESGAIALANLEDGIFLDSELFLLADQSTAWAAEVFCATAQAQGRATVLGGKTHGLPWAYEFIPLKNGGFLHFSKKAVALPGNQVLTKKGIHPDWELKDHDAVAENQVEGDALLARAIDYVKRAEPIKKAS